ncbi:MAG TPA: J domain-containing protein [Micropepsaceae bacterium]|nr:J domain-containing protein [Micropepsaceae bacterium]
MHGKGKVAKTAVLTEISLVDGTVLCGNLFLPNQARITDVLNDDRKFLPVQTLEGDFVSLAKSVIMKASEYNQNPAPAPYEGNDPWHILGVKQGASADELKHAYHELARTHHPDRIKAMGLGRNYEELATKDMARINSAYADILKKINPADASESPTE